MISESFQRNLSKLSSEPKMRIINDSVVTNLRNNIPIKLHLGAGETQHEGFYNLDIEELPGIDIVADLNENLSLIPDKSVSDIYSRHVFEHISNLIGLMSEIHRISAPDAKITIIVPHFSNPNYYSDPTHVRFFGLYSMHYFQNREDQIGRSLPSFYCTTRFKILDLKFNFYRTSLFDRLTVPIFKALVNLNFTTQAFYERRLSWIFPAWEIRYTITPIQQ